MIFSINKKSECRKAFKRVGNNLNLFIMKNLSKKEELILRMLYFRDLLQRVPDPPDDDEEEDEEKPIIPPIPRH